MRSGGREACRAVDLNFDGKIDVWSYNDSSGRLRRKEYDFDRDGVIDEIATFQAGVITSKQRATLLANRLDTWDFYQNGALARSERDSDADAVVDQWWEYPKPGCPMIHTDANDDGRPDPGTTIDYCKETGYVPPERQYYRQTEGPSFRDETSAPTEVENREEGTPLRAAGEEVMARRVFGRDGFLAASAVALASALAFVACGGSEGPPAQAPKQKDVRLGRRFGRRSVALRLQGARRSRGERSVRSRLA